jgi:DNA repair exonuclease SbcCD nuclease subunit
MDDAILQKFKMVVSGHFHEPSTKGNVNYLGAPCQYTWSDCGGWRGFGIFDTETFGLTKVQNPNVIFMTVGYDDAGGLPNLLDQTDGLDIFQR